MESCLRSGGTFSVSLSSCFSSVKAQKARQNARVLGCPVVQKNGAGVSCGLAERYRRYGWGAQGRADTVQSGCGAMVLKPKLLPGFRNGNGVAVCALGGRARSEEADEEERGGLTLPFLGHVKQLSDITQISPLKATATLAIAAASWTLLSILAQATILNADVWMYGSWFLVIWPWPTAIALGIWTLVIAARRANAKPKEWEQVLMLGGALVWIVLVPLAHFHGFVDGWPLLLFFLYSFFFSINAIIRSRLYGSLSIPSDDTDWVSTPSKLAQIGFSVAVIAGHWFAAYEAPFLVFTWNWGWKSKLAAAVLALAVVLQYYSTYFLGKYSNRLVKPGAVVSFGPYRFVRHPMYASYILLFAGYCMALRSYLSLLFLTAVSLIYYNQRAKVEEDQLVHTFGPSYTSYRDRTKHKYLPFVY